MRMLYPTAADREAQHRNEIALCEVASFERDMRAKYGPDIDVMMTADETAEYETIAGRVNWKLACIAADTKEPNRE